VLKPPEGSETGAETEEETMDRKIWETGLAKRKQVLGEEYVDRAMRSADDFNRPFQDILNEHCWGTVWGDERIPMKTRSMINLGLIAGVNRMEEWELHLRGAIRNGVTRDEIQSILHQIAMYAGMPAGVACFRIARKVFAEIDARKA
jgi:4-carboxymuconolactone decarboxylase